METSRLILKRKSSGDTGKWVLFIVIYLPQRMLYLYISEDNSLVPYQRSNICGAAGLVLDVATLQAFLCNGLKNDVNFEHSIEENQ